MLRKDLDVEYEENPDSINKTFDIDNDAAPYKTLTDNFSKSHHIKNEIHNQTTGYTLTFSAYTLVNYVNILVRYANNTIINYVFDNSKEESDKYNHPGYQIVSLDQLYKINTIIRLTNVQNILFSDKTLKLNNVSLIPELDITGNSKDADVSGEWLEIYRDTILSIGQKNVCQVGQIVLNTHPQNLEHAIQLTNDPTKWMYSDPIYQTYKVINFAEGNPPVTHFNNTTVNFPYTDINGKKANYSTSIITSALIVPETDTYTFSIGSDDGFRLILTDEHNNQYISEFSQDRSYGTTYSTFNLTKGVYSMYMFFYEQGGQACLDLSVAVGNHSSFNNQFKLVGDPDCVIKVK